MSYRFLTALMALSLLSAGQLTAQMAAQPDGPSFTLVLGPIPASIALLPASAPLATGFGTGPSERPVVQSPEGGGGARLLVEVALLGAASFAGLWAGAQPPFPPVDDDSDLSLWHLLTAPTASVAAVAATSLLLGHGMLASVNASLVGAAAGLGVGLLSSMFMETGTAAVTYAGVHGLVTALKAR